MLIDWSSLAVSDGTERSDRLVKGLRPGHFTLQERTLPELFALAGALAATEPAGLGGSDPDASWRVLFEQEPAFHMAEVLAVRLDLLDRRYRFLAARNRIAASVHTQQLGIRVARWIAALQRMGGPRFSAQLSHLQIQQGMTERLEALDTVPSPALVPRLARRLTGGLPARGESPIARARREAQGLDDLHAALLNAIATLQKPAETAFPERLASGEIDPMLGLLLAELGLLQRVGTVLNDVQRRHTDYFYTDVLGQHPRPEQTERILLHVAAGPAPVFMPAETIWAEERGDISLRYTGGADLLVQPCEVTGLASLRYDRNPLISPQSAFGAITGVRADLRAPAGMPLARPPFSPDPAAPVAFGLDIHSPMLDLAEGERRIEVVIRMRRRSDLAAAGNPVDPSGEDPPAPRTRADPQTIDPDIEQAIRADPALIATFGFTRPDRAVAVMGRWTQDLSDSLGQPVTLTLLYHALTLRASSGIQLRAVYARVVLATVVEGADWPGGPFREALAERTKVLMSEDQDAAETITRTLDLPAEDAFERLLGTAFALTVSTAEGPVAVPVSRIRANRREDGPGVTLNILLDHTVAPLTPPPGADAPCLSIRQSPEARISPVLFFESFRLDRIKLAVDVRGLTRLHAFNDDGPVEIGAAFPAFGARPEDGASITIASPELGNKPVTEVSVDLTWAGLPAAPGGYASFYSGYGSATVPDPDLHAAYLSGDGWKRLTSKPLPMALTDREERLVARRHLRFRIPGGSAAPTPVTAREYRSRATLRAGALRLELQNSAGFLARAYPAALARAMRAGAMALPLPRRRPKPVPPEPLVPRIERVRLSYRATASIAVNAPSAARRGDRLVQIGPFGAIEIFPDRQRADPGLFPQRLAEGTLFIGLRGPAAIGRQALLFEMEETGHERLPFPTRTLRWHVMAPGGWRALPEAALVSDSTDGLMRSGVITLDIPPDVQRGAPDMPDSADIWLAVSADHHMDAFPALRAVRTNGLWVKRVDAEALPGPAPEPAEPAVWRPDRNAGKLRGVRDTGMRRAGRPPEHREAFLARVSERLAHRGRALTARDAERLILQAFPDVWKAKCFPAFDRASPDPAPGLSTVVVVPRPDRALARGDWQPQPLRFDVQTLRRIETFLAERGPVGAAWEVVNPSYERLQVRASIGFDAQGDAETLAARLNADLWRYLSVWTAEPPLDGFGWRLNPERLRAWLLARPEIVRVGAFSVLHLVQNDARQYRLSDTARWRPDGAFRQISGQEPWSLPLSWPDHTIELSDAIAEEDKAQPAGLSSLPLGSLLVVQRREDTDPPLERAEANT